VLLEALIAVIIVGLIGSATLAMLGVANRPGKADRES
jgi:hypothetical protein